MISWLGDFFRFWWSLGYWNLRKSWFRIRGRHPAACPCQNPGDSGLPLHSRCEAASTWNRAERFRRVCPLLVPTPAGLRCSVAAEDVRPFWLRAAGYSAAGLLVVYLALAFTAFLGLKRIGYEVGLDSVLWPGKWPEVRIAQERLYARRAQQALAAGDFPAAILALEMVTELNPRNQPAALALANLWQLSGRPTSADAIYERLLRDFPAQRLELARLWYRALLARGDYTRIKPLALQFIREDDASRAAWLHALVFATRQSRDPAPLRQLAGATADLPDWARFVIGLELARQTDDPSYAADLGRVQPPPASAYVPLYQADRLIEEGRHQDALKLLEAYAGRVPADEAGFRRLEAYRLLGWRSLADAEADTLLSFPMRPRLAAQFSAHLLRHPDRALLARFADRFVRDGPRPEPAAIPTYAAVLLAAERCGDRERAAYLAELIRRQSESGFKGLDALRALVAGDGSAGRVEQLMPAVPLPTEVQYAVLEIHDRGADR